MGLLGSVGANVAQWGADFNKAIGGDAGVGNYLNNASSAMRDPNKVYTGSLNPFTALSQAGGQSQFSSVTPAASAHGAAPINQNPGQQLTPASSIYNTGGGGGTAANPADIAAYQDQIGSLNQLLQNADVTKNNGMASIDRNYQSGYNQLTDQNNQALQNFSTAQQKADKGYQTNIQGINSNSRNSFNSLQRLLAGSGSAAEVLAPYLVAQQANQQKTGAATNYADNQQSITTAKKNTADTYQHSLDSLLGQKNDKLSQLLSSIDQQKIQYQQQLGSAQNQLNIAKGGGYTTPSAQNNAISALIAEQNGLASQYADPTFQVTNLSTAAPDVSGFQQQAAQLGNGSNQAPNTAQGADATTSALAALLKQQQDQNNSAYAY